MGEQSQKKCQKYDMVLEKVKKNVIPLLHCNVDKSDNISEIFKQSFVLTLLIKHQTNFILFPINFVFLSCYMKLGCIVHKVILIH